jgi:hypothetical protein
MNLDVTADDSCLDPHVSCVQTSHPAAPLDVNSEQRSVRQSMMSGPHREDSAHIHYDAWDIGEVHPGVVVQVRRGLVPSGTVFSVIVGTYARPPRRPHERSELTGSGKALAGVLNLGAGRVRLDRLNALLGVRLRLVTLAGRDDLAVRGLEVEAELGPRDPC